MTDRGRSPVDASVACPFVAFEEDRDARSDVPDPRHRCFAELRPAPRAIAHQQAYCLSSGFAACPTFMDWAHREAARVRERPASRGGRGAAGLAAAGLAAEAGEARAEAGDEEEAAAPAEQVWPRRSDREWAAPPPWGVEHGQAEPPAEPGAPPPPFLAASVADDLAGRPGRPAERPGRPDRPDRVAGPAGATSETDLGPADSSESWSSRSGSERYDEPYEAVEEPPMRRFTPDARRRADRQMAERRNVSVEGPAWESPRRSEAYPTLRPPRVVSRLSPLVLAVAALIIGALALFFIPPLLLGIGGSSSSTPTPSPSPSTAVASPSPTVSPSPSPGAQVYVVKSGDTLSAIAGRYKLTLPELLAANPQIKDPNKVAIGDKIVIPKPGSPSGVIQGASPSPSPS